MMLFDGSGSEPKTLREVVGQAVGAGSCAWEDTFETDRAVVLVNEVIGWIEQNYEPKAKA